jgi:hypothetical protein
MSIELKIKQVSLALEAQYIKKQEAKLAAYRAHCIMISAEANDSSVKQKYQTYADNHSLKQSDLAFHRRGIVADEARSTNIARAYLKGKPYSYAESKGYNENNQPNIRRIAQITYKYGVGKGYFSATPTMLDKQIATITAWINQK